MTRDPETVNNIIEDKIAKFTDLARSVREHVQITGVYKVPCFPLGEGEYQVIGEEYEVGKNIKLEKV